MDSPDGDRRGGKAFCSVVPPACLPRLEREAESLREASERVRRGVRGAEKRGIGRVRTDTCKMVRRADTEPWFDIYADTHKVRQF